MATYPFIFFIEDDDPDNAIELAEGLAEDKVNQDLFSHYCDGESDAHLVGLPETTALIEKILGEQEHDILNYLKQIRAMMATHTDQEIMNEADGARRDPFFRVGMYRGSEVRFYDQDGCGLRTREDITNAINTKPSGDMKLYAVEVNCHV